MKTKKYIPLMSPDIKDSDIRKVSDVLHSGMLVQGKEIAIFEKKIANYLGIKHAICVSNGTASLHLSLLVLGIGPGDEVIIPAFSYIATANVIELVGAKPIFVDISLDSFNIDCNKIETSITEKTKAIIPVHEFGLSADLKIIKKIAKKHNLFIIEDAACALGAQDNGKYVGTIGDLGSFSFHPRKAITSGEGGLIVTNNDLFAKKLRAMRNHGIEIINNKIEFILPGFNYRMTDFQAALLNNQFIRFEKILKKKRTLADLYQKNIINKNIIKPRIPKNKIHSWQTYHIILNGNLNRDLIKLKLKAEGIETNYGAQCIPTQFYFQEKYKLNCIKLFPNSMKAYLQGLAIPLYEKITLKQIIYISKTLNKL